MKSNNTKTQNVRTCIHQLVEVQVAQTPQEIAVVSENQQLTYKELNCRANQLAHCLQKLGVKPEKLVGICIERSFELMIAILAVLKSGGAYVPLDPAYPQERLAYMLSDANVQVLLTTEVLLKASPLIAESAKEREIVCLDRDWPKISLEKDVNPVSLVNLHNLAYIIYTSGSTGKPKGVMMEHLALANLIDWHLQNRIVKAKTLQFAPVSFDISFHEIFSTWCSGGTLVLISEEVRHDPQALLDALAQNQIAKLYLPFIALQQLAEVSKTRTAPTTLREVMTAGEQLQITPAIANFFRQTGCTLHNHYGATECQDVTTLTLTGDANTWPLLPAIGSVIDNIQAYILDEFYQPVPIGVPGELYIGGDGLARGYFNRPDLTQERFIPNPFGSGRLYKTGDLARYRKDGNIEHLGRADSQVKIRGFRVELGEIEGMLGKHPLVRENVVIARENIPGNKRLVAYVVPVSGDVRTQPELTLRRYLQEHLPDYMVPAVIVILEKMPLTPSGKIDRQALREPDQARRELEANVMPRSHTEQLIAGVWQDVLGLEPIGIDDNFFELGGNSLLLIQVQKKLSDLGVRLPTVALFKHPTLQVLAKHLDQSDAIASPSDLPLVKVARTENLPLSAAQESIWFLSQLEPDNPFYNEIEALRLSGSLNVVALQQSLNKIIQRHEVLRTNFSLIDGHPVQVIAKNSTLSLSIVNLSNLPENERDIATQELITTRSQQPFDLQDEPLIQATLVKLAEAEQILLLKIHHIVWDGWSMDVFVRELAAFYNDLSLALPQLPIQYADYAVWQQQRSSQAIIESQLSYWQQQLEVAPALLELPTDRVRPARQTFRGASQTVPLSWELTKALKRLSQRQGVTLFMTLLAAFQVLLSRYTGQTDICVGTVHANRDRSEVQGLIGFFINTLVLRTDLSDNPSFTALLARVREVALGAYAYKDFPFEKLVEKLQPVRDLSYTPLVQVMLAFNEPMPQIQIAGLTVSPLTVETATAKFDLTLFLENSDQGLIGRWEYNTDLFETGTIARMAGHFQTLLEAIVSTPKQPIGEFPLLTDAQRHQLLEEWNETQTLSLQNKCIHQLFENVVQQKLDAVAVVFQEQQLTYGELNTKANQLAHYLKTLGVGPEVLVGICVERSLEMVVGLLAILKAGGAYVPLDPAYPDERLAFMLCDTALKVLLTQKRLVERLPNHHATVVCLDTQWEEIAQQSEKNLLNEVTSDNLAYVIYTSGSTGKPKGVCCHHLGVVNLLADFQSRKPLSVGDRCSLWTSLSFDVSVYEIFSALLAGAALHIVPEPIRLEAIAFFNWLSSGQICSAYIPPFMLDELSDWLEQAPNPLSLQRLLVGVEPIDELLLGSLSQRIGDLHIINGYGPAEATICATLYSVPPQSASNRNTPIGKPVQNTQIYLLDDQMQPVPVGVLGEIYIGGIGLARGYLNRPDLTAEKFIPNPFTRREQGAGSREQVNNLQPSTFNLQLYKTGDLARYLPDGNIEFKGRIDNQVKIRGFRIELGEIEATLSNHPIVQQTVAIAREDVPGDKRIVAYVVTQQVPPSASESLSERKSELLLQLRRFLQDKLPQYMVPSTFVFMDALPLTPNGKIDRRALPTPKTVRALERITAPRTPIEEMLANIWAEVLQLKQVGIEDNFFDLGGHSLLATQIISRIRTNLAVEIPLRDLFKNPTVSSLAQCLETTLQSGISSATLPLIPTRRPQALPLSFSQARLWFLEQLEPKRAFYNIAIALRLKGSLKIAALQQSLNDIIGRHEVLRTNFVVQDGQPVQVIANSLSLSLPIVDLQAIAETERELLMTKEAQQGFDLEREPLIRAKLFQWQPQEYVLLLVIHHIIFDGWSMEILARELAALYKGYCTNQPAVLPQLPIQYADFAYGQQQWFQKGNYQSQLTYWKKQLEGANFVLELPTDYPHIVRSTRKGAQQSLALFRPLSESLVSLSKKEGATLFMTLLAAFGTLLWRYTGQDDICIGTPIANRNRTEIEGLIGFFVNTLVLRTDLRGNPSFRQLLSRIREVAIDAYVHQDFPFEQLVEQLQPERDLSRHPIFQVWFNLLEEDTQLELFGLSVEPLSMPEAASKFDLSLYVTEQKHSIQLNLIYNTDLFEAETIQRMLWHYQTLLQSIVANPEQSISTLPLLTQKERDSLKNRGNVVRPSNPFIEFCKQDIERSIPVRFQEQVRKYPSNIAVSTQNYQWTYRELNRQANRVAQAILKQAPFKTEKIALLFEHDAPMVAGILGVLKAGKIYVPLDPNYPSKRVAYILEDSQASAVLTNNKNLAHARELTQDVIPLLNIDDFSFIDSLDEVKSEISPDAIAYILYTSGSTGQPKGVIQNHRNVLHFIRNYTNNLHINHQDGLTLLSSYSFDAAVMDIFAAILNGATLYPISIKEEGFTYLFQCLQQQRITIYHSTPTLYRHFVSTLSENEQLSKIRLVVLGGEEVIKTDVELYKKHFSDECIFVNGLGPTESTVTLQYFLNQQIKITRNTVPIGYPVEETEILLLNEAGEQTDFYGEIAIKSPYVALGYWQKPDLTQTVFLSNSEWGSRRIYRTGDLGRFRLDGSLEFLGRKDFQVKIRGFRIELGEIEAALLKARQENTHHPIVREAIVIATVDGVGNKHLIAYIVPTQTLTTEELRYILKQKLPDYMIPSSFVFLDNLPLTPNGKVNRRALPAPNLSRIEVASFVAPRTPTEEILAAIWTEVLALESIGIHDNFFELGGHSLLSIGLMARIYQKFGKNLPLATLFQNATIEHLASLLGQPLDSQSLSPLVAIQPYGKQRPFFCIHPIGGHVFCYKNLARYLGLEQPFYGLQSPGLNGEQNPHTCIEDMAIHYLKAIQTIQPQGPYQIGGWSLGGIIAFEMAAQLQVSGHQVALLALIDSFAPLAKKTHEEIDEEILNILAKDLGNLFGKELLISVDKLKQMESEQQLNFILEQAKRLDILPPEAGLRQMRYYLQVLKHNLQAKFHYIPKPYSGQINLFCASEKTVKETQDLSQGWNKLANGNVKVVPIPGDHYTLLQEPHVQILGAELTKTLLWIREANLS